MQLHKIVALEEKFRTHVRGLNEVLEALRESYPNANYYLALETLYVLSDESHDENGNARQDRILLLEYLRNSGGGDW